MSRVRLTRRGEYVLAAGATLAIFLTMFVFSEVAAWWWSRG